MVIDINYETGWAIVRHGWNLHGNPISHKTALDGVQRQLKKDGYAGIRGKDESMALVDWEHRRGNKTFEKPEAMFVIRLTDPTGKYNIGRTNMNGWPE